MTDNGVTSVEDLMTKVFESVRKNPDKQTEKKERYKPEFLNEDHTLVKGKS